MDNIIPVVGIVYKSENENWRGFCYPYDLSCNANTKELAQRKLEEMIQVYEEVISKYKNPKHLVEKQLTDSEDKKVFEKLWPQIQKKVAEQIKKASTPRVYTSGLSKTKKFNYDSNSIFFSHRGVPLAA